MKRLAVVAAVFVLLGCTPEPEVLMFYNGRSWSQGYQIGVAELDGDTWVPRPEPLFMRHRWAADHLKDPWVERRAGAYRMYYAGHDGARYHVGLATSNDAEAWTDHGSPVLSYPGGAWFPVVAGNHMWFGTRDGIGLAHSRDGVNWTFKDIVIDGLLPGAIKRIDRRWYLFYSVRPSQTHPVGDEVHLASFAHPDDQPTLHGKVLEPTGDGIYSGALTMRDVERDGDGFIGYGTAFHFTPELREVSVVFRAPAIEGPWRIDTEAGAILPLDGGWDSISAENPNVVLH